MYEYAAVLIYTLCYNGRENPRYGGEKPDKELNYFFWWPLSAS